MFDITAGYNIIWGYYAQTVNSVRISTFGRGDSDVLFKMSPQRRDSRKNDRRCSVKKALSLLSVLILLLVTFASGVTAYALPTPTNATSVASSTVYCLPDNTSSMTIGSIGIETVSVYWAEGNSYYIQYTVNSGAYSGYKRGYVPKSVISVSGIGGINYASFPAHTSSNQTVYNRSTTSSMTIGTVFSSDNITVLQEDGSWYYIQYPVSGGYKRGYVPKSTVVAAAAQPTGNLEVVNSSQISGWAWISTSPNTSIEVHIYITNTVTGARIGQAVIANQYRPDLAAAGIGNGYHAFSYAINWNNFPEGTYSVEAYGIGGINPALSNSPRSYDLTASICFNNGVFYIKNVNSSKYLDVYNSGTTNGTNVIQYSMNGGTNQQWQAIGLGNGYHMLRPRHTTGLALGVDNNYTSNSSNISVRTASLNSVPENCQWKIVSVGNGAYKVISKCSGSYGKVMVVQGASTSNGANVFQYSYNGTHNDEWVFENIDPYAAMNWRYVFDDSDYVRISNGYYSTHKAIDIVSKNNSNSIANASIRCPANGTVIRKDKNDDAGYYLIIETNDYDPITGNKIRVGFQHLASEALTGAGGTTVTKGQIIGYVGNTGSTATGYHLHLYMMSEPNIWTNTGKTVNPQNFYPNISFTGSTGGPYTIG